MVRMILAFSQLILQLQSVLCWEVSTPLKAIPEMKLRRNIEKVARRNNPEKEGYEEDFSACTVPVQDKIGGILLFGIRYPWNRQIGNLFSNKMRNMNNVHVITNVYCFTNTINIVLRKGWSFLGVQFWTERKIKSLCVLWKRNELNTLGLTGVWRENGK